jgi:NAD(P)-dependent dehydrogenase (short-subunit alcohol dehydrogenase family)
VKAFLDQVTRVAAVEFAARGITVNAVAPGSTATGPIQHGPVRGPVTVPAWESS